MNNILKRLLVLILALAMVISMTSCDIVLGILDAYLGEDVDDVGPGAGDEDLDTGVEILSDKNQTLSPSNPYYGLRSGYNFNTELSEDTVHVVNSYAEMDDIFDEAIANCYKTVKFDFKNMLAGFADVEDFFLNGYLPNANRELNHLAYYEYSFSTRYPTFTLIYDNETASFALPQTVKNTYKNYKNGNMLVRDYLDGEPKRSADFEDFAITKKNAGTMAVYNSESLWWALEHNYLPVFPAKNTKAEAFYEEAKSILRTIVNDDMTEYEKALAIFEYLVDMVSYDYDALDAAGSDGGPNNVCYFLEGVFEYKRAVCDGKSKAFVLLCRMEGIECVRDWGESYIAGQAGHAWNYIKIDGVWYMVDTTAGDAGINFLDLNVRAEVVDYSFFLCPVNTYKKGAGYSDTAYIYSGTWDDLLKGNNNNSNRASKYYEVDVDANGHDFVISGYTELNYIIDTMFDATGDEIYLNYSLKFTPVGNDLKSNIFKYIDDAVDIANVDYYIYDYTDVGYYLVLFIAK